MANPVIVCGSGPQLNKVPVREPGYPLAVVSTAIRTIMDPDYWLLVDIINTPHGDQGKEAAKNPDVKKIVPHNRMKLWEAYPNIEGVHQTPEGPKHGNRTFLDGKGGVISGQNLHRSMLFALQVLSARFDTLIFAGCDMGTNPSGVLYSHGFVYPERQKPHRRRRSRINSITHALDMEMRRWEEWAPIARAKGVTWLSFTPDSPINNLMEPFEWPVPTASHSQGERLPPSLSTLDSQVGCRPGLRSCGERPGL